MDRHSSHSQRVPYAKTERRKSLLSKVKDSVKDILSPSWLTDLVTSVKKEPSAESSSSDVGYSGQQVTPTIALNAPASARMPTSGLQHTPEYLPFQGQSPALVNGQPRTLEFSRAITPGETISPFPQTGVLPPPALEFTSSQLPLARITDKSDSVLANEDTMSQRSDVSKSTSGCSSMVPQLEVPREGGAEKRKAPDSKHPQDGTGPPSSRDQPSTKRQRLHVNISNNKTWSHRLNESNISMNQSSVSRPAFNVSLFASPLNDSSILGSSFHESSFYPGKTSFGGKSSMSFRSQRLKQDLNQSLPSRLSIPVKAFMKAKPRANPEKEAVTSATAKRIMDALNKLPTPLNDARKIPIMVPNQWTENPSFFSQTRRSPSGGPPTQRLNVSSQASISKNRQISSSPLPPARREQPKPMPETQNVPSRRQETVMLDANGPSLGASGKMRREKSYHRPSAAARAGSLEEEEEMPAPNLRSDFTLPVSQLPKFTFSAGSSLPTSTQGSSFVSPKKPAINFTFSSPIQQSQPAQKPASPGVVGGFQFSSPINIDKQQDNSSPTQTNKFSFSSPMSTGSSGMTVSFSAVHKPKPKTNGPSTLDDSAVVGIQPPTEMKMGSVMDILGKSSSKSTTTTSSSASSENVSTPKASLPSLGSMFKPSGWSCDICLVNNKEGVEKCAACQTPKPAKQSATNAASSTLSTSGSATPSQSLFKQVVPSGTWTCDVCLIQNKPDISKCAACQTLKPGSTGAVGFIGFGSSTAKSSTWTCDTCLIQNKVEVQVCAACSANKPASKSDTSGKSSSSDSLFDKFKPASGQWSCEVCLVQNKTDVTSCVACQTPKPSKPFKHPPGDWTCDTCLVSNNESDVACVACRYTRPGPPRTQTVPSCAKSYSMSQAGETSGITVSKTGGFTFGSLSTSQSDTKSGFTFGAPSSEKKTEPATGGFKFGASKDFNSVPVTGGFKIVGSSVESSSTPATGGFKFGGSDSSGSTPLGAGFKFGAPSGESSSTTPSGGFKFGAPISSTSSSETKTTTGFQLGSGTNTTSASSEVKVSSASISEQASIGGFQFGTSSVVSGEKPDTEKAAGANQTSDVSSKTGFNGFQFGQSDSSSSSLASNTAPVVSTSNSLTTGFSFGQTSVNSLPNDPLKATMSVPGGFSFQTSSSSASSASGLTNTSTSQTGVSQPSIGGFTFSATNKTETSSAPPSSSSQAPTGGFSFGAANTSTQESTKTETKAGFGGFVFGQKPPESSTSTTSMLGGFNFAQKAPTSQPAGSETSTTKRGRDEDTGETTAKKQFSFGAASSSGAFQFKSTTTSSSSSAPFVFGQQNASASPAPAFAFTGKAAESTPAQAPGFSTTGFNFNAPKTDSSTGSTGNAPLFKFGAASSPAQPSTTTAFGAGSSPSVFGGANTAFGGTPAPAFGSAQPFGMQNSNSAPSAPVFGGAFGSNSAQPQQPAQNSAQMFQFGGKAPETTTAAPSFNFGAAPAAGGAPAPFNFGAAPAPAAQNAFSVSSTGVPPSTGDRKIRRAVRKIRR